MKLIVVKLKKKFTALPVVVMRLYDSSIPLLEILHSVVVTLNINLWLKSIRFWVRSMKKCFIASSAGKYGIRKLIKMT